MTSTSAEHDRIDHPEDDEPPRRSALAIASVALGAVALVIDLGTWVGWLVVRPALGIDNVNTVFLGTVLVLLLGALWFLALATGVLGLTLGFLRGARGPRADELARLGAVLNFFAAAVALAGAVVFIFGMAQLHEVINPGVYPTYFN